MTQIIIEVTGIKNCSCCGVQLVVGENWPIGQVRKGQKRCRECTAAYMRVKSQEWRDANREHYRAYQREYQRAYKKSR